MIVRRRENWVALALFLGGWALYALTAAPGTIFGDPSEYQFIPAIWGIAHPPGYAFYTLLAGVWQRIFPVGSVAFRTNLLAGAVGAWTVTRIFFIVRDLGAVTFAHKRSGGLRPRWALGLVPSLLAALALAIASDFWQHSIHANAHIVSVALTTTQLWLLVRWYRETSTARQMSDSSSLNQITPLSLNQANSQSSMLNSQSSMLWLYIFAFVAGLGVTHHPITVFGFPAYAAFILIHRPRILIQPKTLLLLVGCGLLGLLPWLYFPLRSPSAPFGPTDMRTWEGFLRHATAQGLRVNLFHFGLADQVDRLRVFWTLLRLQYTWPFLILIGIGALVLARRRPRLAILWGLFLLGHLGFTLNSVQDVMAYLLHAFAALAVLSGIGLSQLTLTLSQSSILNPQFSILNPQSSILTLLLFIPLLASLIWTFPRISLRDWRTADRFVAGLWERFEGEGEHAALVSDWEHLTPYFYHTYVEGHKVAAEDLRPVYVTSTQPWPESVFGNLPLGPVYLSNYRREIRELGFRLRPAGGGLYDHSREHYVWRVLEPPAMTPVIDWLTFKNAPEGVWVDGRLELLGYKLLLPPEDTRPKSDASPIVRVPQGGVLPLVLYARVPTTQTDILMPYARLGQAGSLPDSQVVIEQHWTTDSRRLTPAWRPGEIIAELYEVFIPYTFAPGRYTLKVGYVNMSQGNRSLEFSAGQPGTSSAFNSQFLVLSSQLEVTPGRYAAKEARVLSRALTNIGNDVALVSARARVGLTTRGNTAARVQWAKPLPVKPGGVLHLTLRWQALGRPRTSYTVFIHLLDAQERLWMGHDYTPLGGAFPSYLWFPKWLEGQRVIDPYRLTVPAEIPPGQYWLEVGMYEMGSIRRIPQLAFDGTMVGDRFIVGPVLVRP